MTINETFGIINHTLFLMTTYFRKYYDPECTITKGRKAQNNKTEDAAFTKATKALGHFKRLYI